MFVNIFVKLANLTEKRMYDLKEFYFIKLYGVLTFQSVLQ